MRLAAVGMRKLGYTAEISCWGPCFELESQEAGTKAHKLTVPVKLGMGVQKQWVGEGESRKTFSNSLGMAKYVGSNEFEICIAE